MGFDLSLRIKVIIGIIAIILTGIAVRWFVHNSWIILDACDPANDTAKPPDKLQTTLEDVFRPKHACIGE